MQIKKSVLKNFKIKNFSFNQVMQLKYQQECIPVGCVPSAAVAVCGGGGEGVCPGGCVCPGEGCVCPGVCLPRGCLPRAGVTPPCEQNDRCL